MGRIRNTADQWMPPRVYRGRSAFDFRPKSGGNIRLCPLDSSKSIVWKCYEDAIKTDHTYTVSMLFDEYFTSPSFKEKAPRTQKDYHQFKKNLLTAFGKMHVMKVEPKHVRMFMDKKAIKSGTVQANRHKSALQTICAWAYERGKIKVNPCIGIKKFRERSRERYVTDEEYQALLDAACPVVYAASEIAYLCMARKGDVLKLRREQLTSDGIYIKQGKTGKAQIKAWGTRLKNSIKHANKINPAISSLFIIHQANGSSYTDGGFRARWVATLERAKQASGLLMDFTFHDLKAKGISDFKGSLESKREAAGHTTTKQTADYDRRIHIVQTVESKN